MLLQREEIIKALEVDQITDRLIISPLLEPDRQIGPGSVDLRLGSGFIEVRRRHEQVVDPSTDPVDVQAGSEDRYEVPIGESLFIHPGQFLLGATFEFIQLPPHLGGQVLGRSSWGRLGLVVATAVTVQPGFRGCLTLELQNLGPVPIRLFPGLRVAQLMLWTTAGPTGSPYSDDAKYSAPLGPESSRIGWERDEIDRLVEMGRNLRGMT